MPKVLCLVLPILLIAGLFWGPDRDGTEVGIQGRSEVALTDQAGAPSASARASALRVHRAAGREGRDPEVTSLLARIDPSLLAELEPEEVAQVRTYLAVRSSSGGRPPTWCWSEETRPAKVEAFAAAEAVSGRGSGLGSRGPGLLARQFLSGGRWEKTAWDGTEASQQGDAVVVTWSVVPDGTLVSGVSGEADAGSDLRVWMTSIYGGTPGGAVEEQPWFAYFEEAAALMSATSGLVLQYEPNDDGADFAARPPGRVDVRGDIRIGARFLDGNGGLLGISLGPDEGDMVLDSGDGNLDLTGADSIRLVNTLTHELGHCLGLAHVCPVDQTKLMEPNLTTAFRGPQFDEFQSLQRLYGDHLERRNGFRDNDRAERATGLAIGVGDDFEFPRLSIDDNGDVDFFAIEVLGGQRLKVLVRPGEGAYPEGGQGSGGCGAGALFDSRTVHDLKVEIWDRDGESVLAVADDLGPGGEEEITSLEFPRSGRYFIKVTGDEANATQLYELELRLEERLPGPRLVLDGPRVVEESGVVKNGRPDPGETVRVRFPLQNEGTLPSGDLRLTVEGPEEVTIFEQAVPEGLAPGEAGFVEVVFGALGQCGDEVSLTLAVANEAGVSAGLVSRFQLGEINSPTPIKEDFDAGRELPDGWESGRQGGGRNWEAASSNFDTPLRSAFSPGSNTVGQAFLISPPFVLAQNGGTLSFRHQYRMEAGYDGGILEVSRDGGDWTDLVTGFGLEVTGGYDRTIREGFGSPLAGRLAWSGRLGEFRSTTIALPPAWAGEVLRFRWRFGHDRSGQSEGWWVDTVKVVMAVADCPVHRAALDLRRVGGGLDENRPAEVLRLQLATPLPLLGELTIPLELGGTAGSDDYTGDFLVVLPSGETTVEIPVRVQADEVEEGGETVVIAVPAEGAGFVAGEEATVTAEIRDRVDFERWSLELFGEVVDPNGDRDGDGWSELAEYVLGTDPGDGRGVAISPVVREGEVLIPLTGLPERDDAGLGVEVSENLADWEAVPFTRTDEGLVVSAVGDLVFLRLTFRLNP